MYPFAFLLATGELVIVDRLASLKLHDWCNSPYIHARSTFWEDKVELFPAFSPHFPCFYWLYGPVLALPERAESLSCAVCESPCILHEELPF